MSSEDTVNLEANDEGRRRRALLANVTKSTRFRMEKASFQPSEERACCHHSDQLSWMEPNMKRIFDNNQAWSSKILSNNPDHFQQLSKGQKPQYLLIGCSDSRVPAEAILGLGLGEVFIHRNVANLCVNTDMNFLAVLSYAVEHLGVQDIIVLGHYGCGGVKAALDNRDHGLLAHWLRNIRDIHRMHQDELKNIDDPQERHDRLVEINVQEQCMNMYTNEIVQGARAKKGYPRVHGMMYNVENGLLKMLDINFDQEVHKYKDIFNAYEAGPSGEESKDFHENGHENLSEKNWAAPPGAYQYTDDEVPPTKRGLKSLFCCTG